MGQPEVVLGGIVMGESVRWHDGELWFSDWGAGEVVRVVDGKAQVQGRVEGLPFCLEWTPGGELLVVEGRQAVVTRGGERWADLSGVDGVHPWNDVAADSRGNLFVNNIGYDFPGGEEQPGIIAVVGTDGVVRPVADGLRFPNGMAVTGDDSTLIVAESHAGRLTAYDIGADGSLSRRRVWAAVEGSAPDGICLDPSGALWYADVPNRQCVLVREGGEVVRKVGFADGAFDCALADDGTLYAVTADYTDRQMFAKRTGKLYAVSPA
ncbi:SMP-30/gluconolactonase/LRE family protein [Actinoplanes sp. NPDC051411]|jgi:sugar lactone lactonase YvrE|uniref:SMP-30/gluconolactonase/LRE family protein n=1 Tax=Actinoplanes sp. NPDC051411 TaxID=3155522 RepID=UPI003439D6E7